MRRCRIFGVLAGMVLFALPGCSPEVQDAGAADPREVGRSDADLVIRGARILDGLGNPAVEGDIEVDHGVIVTLGPASGGAYRGAREIDADGRYVTPGFVYPHSHGDLMETPEFENFLAMGVTTITLGQDGSSPAVDNLGAWLAEVEARGNAADLIVFDPRAVSANASYVDPLQLADEFDIVIVNGHVARDQGRLSTTLAGTTLHPRK